MHVHVVLHHHNRTLIGTLALVFTRCNKHTSLVWNHLIWPCTSDTDTLDLLPVVGSVQWRLTGWISHTHTHTHCSTELKNCGETAWLVISCSHIDWSNCLQNEIGIYLIGRTLEVDYTDSNQLENSQFHTLTKIHCVNSIMPLSEQYCWGLQLSSDLL